MIESKYNPLRDWFVWMVYSIASLVTGIVATVSFWIGASIAAQGGIEIPRGVFVLVFVIAFAWSMLDRIEHELNRRVR